MNEKIVQRIKNYEITINGFGILAIGIVFILFIVFFCICTRSGSKGELSELQTSTDNTIRDIKQELDTNRQQIRDGRDAIKFAQDSIETASERIGRSEKLVIENNERIAEIERLVRECREINNDTRRTLQSIGK